MPAVLHFSSTVMQQELSLWIEQQERLVHARKAGAGYGVTDPKDVPARTGIEHMQAVLEGTLPAAWIEKTLGFHLIEVQPGTVIYQGEPLEAHLNPLGTVHGGWIAALLDCALGGAIHTMVPRGRTLTTLDLNVKYTRGLTSDVARVRAEGKVIHCGRQVAMSEARVFGADGTLYAHATCSCLVFEPLPRA